MQLTAQYTTFVLLAHYSRIMPPTGGKRYLTSTAVFFSEVIKLAVSLTVALYEVSKTAPPSVPATSLLLSLTAAVFSGDSWKLAIPAGLYTLANSLQYIALSNLQAATFQVSYQLQLIVSSIFGLVLLKRTISPRKWALMLLLLLGVGLAQIPNGSLDENALEHAASHFDFPRSLEEWKSVKLNGGNLHKRSATYEGIQEDLLTATPQLNAAVGLLAAIAACGASGVAGVYFEKVLKDSVKATSLWIRNVQLAIYSIFPALFIGVVFLDGEKIATGGLFDGYNWVVWSTILVQAVGGITASFCTGCAYADSTNVASATSIVVTTVASVWLFEFEPTLSFLIGTFAVLVATYLSDNPNSGSVQVKRQVLRPPPIRIERFDKDSKSAEASPSSSPNEISIKLPSTPFLSDAGISTSRPTSPGHARIGNSRTGGFPTSGQPQSSRIIDQKLIDGAQTPPALDTSQKQKFQLFYPDSGFIPAGEDGYNDDLQLDAFDLELLAHTDEPSGSIQSSSNTDHHSTYHQRQEHPPTQATLHRTLGSSSSDVDIGDASSALTRLQNGRAAAPFRDQDITTRRSHQDSQFRFTGLGTPHSYDNPDISSTMSSGKNTVFQNLPVSSRGIVLVSLRELPDNYRSLFHFPVFNAVQSKCFQSVYRSDDNLVLAAPTGSGKTVVMELAICRLLNNLKDERFKVIYQAPTKSLCSERFRDWNRKFHALGLQCAELTGDTDQTQLRHVQNSQIIVTTPEKWDSMTRKWKDHARLMQLVKLFLIDEVHTLKEARGATLEAVVSRMKSIGSTVRFIALSATIPNSEDIATWLGRNSTNQHVPAQREHFDEEFRPVKLQKVVYGYQSHSNDFAFDKMCNSKLLDIITTHSCRKPIMIFCCTRNSAVATAKELARLWSISNPPARLWKGLNKPMEVKNLDLKTTVSAGVGFHHAGLDAADRHQVENGFLGGQISIICCTSTLAVGVNLPCHLVIIKNTVGWQDGCCQEYSDLEIMQMLGRAGRPQFDDSATAVILTRKERVSHYEKLVSGSESLESCLHLNLIDHLNAEIGLGTVTDIESAIRWLAGTFLFVRLRRNPTHYQLREGANQDDEDEMLRQICQKDIKLLQECGLVTLEGLRSTPFGDAMARYYVRFKTMQSFLALNKQAGIAQILSAISEAEEFHNARLKVGEKTLYKEINRSPDISIPIKVDIALPAHKVSLLIQSELGAVEFPDGEQFQKYKFAFQQDKNFVFSHVNRLIRCIIDCQVHLQDSVTAMNALELARSLAAKVWDRSPLQIKQIEQVGVVAVRKLAANGITSIETLEETEPHQIDMILSRNPPFGVKLRGRLADFPKLRVSVKMTGKDVRPGPIAKIRFKAEIGFINEKCPKFFQRRPVHVCFLAEISDGYLIDFRRISVSGIQNSHEILLIAELKSPTQFVTCHVMCDEIAMMHCLFEQRPKFLNNGNNEEPHRASGSATSIGYPKATGKEIKMKEKIKGNHETYKEPTRLDNGLRACNHKCKDKLT
ncbi:hypothetical protein AOCH_002749 [Aspergillus ochraceoroseus]|uniref:DNA 3'-5' helicase n=1 Tax=Aspergillus ochraceoroseus TaxID=138278 RepID=A0A0F8WQQ7_9EURO|nr:hypothetical protein AOCH_002749 [Aspergillus ochraceoroseus]